MKIIPKKGKVLSRISCALCNWKRLYEDDEKFSNEELNEMHHKDFNDHLLESHGIDVEVLMSHVSHESLKIN